jgi:hypothetical protein
MSFHAPKNPAQAVERATINAGACDELAADYDSKGMTYLATCARRQARAYRATATRMARYL